MNLVKIIVKKWALGSTGPASHGHFSGPYTVIFPGGTSQTIYLESSLILTHHLFQKTENLHFPAGLRIVENYLFETPFISKVHLF